VVFSRCSTSVSAYQQKQLTFVRSRCLGKHGPQPQQQLQATGWVTYDLLDICHMLLYPLSCRYINRLCELTDSSFVCSLCGRSTELNSLTLWHKQYCRYPAARQHLPELQQQVYEVLADPDPQDSGPQQIQQLQVGSTLSPGQAHRQQQDSSTYSSVSVVLARRFWPHQSSGRQHGALATCMLICDSSAACHACASRACTTLALSVAPSPVCILCKLTSLHWPTHPVVSCSPYLPSPSLQGDGQPAVSPVTLALVDVAGPGDFLELVQGGLTVAMEALPPGSLFGLIGVSDCISLVDMSGQGGG
jgi:hypothetical protein